jgi:hypothetical protein
VDEVPEENIEQAEDVPDGTSAATQSGLHDRLHDQRGAADD